MKIEKLGITPGPWEMCEHSWSDTSVYKKSDGNKRICTDSIHDDATEENQQELMRNQIANMQLIVAAPEMLDALIEWADDGTFSDYDQHEKILSIIEKATGRTWEEVKELYYDN